MAKIFREKKKRKAIETLNGLAKVIKVTLNPQNITFFVNLTQNELKTIAQDFHLGSKAIQVQKTKGIVKTFLMQKPFRSAML